MTYGIPDQLIPLTPQGEMKRKNHLQMLDRMTTLEEYANTALAVRMVGLPENTDVLLGKGKPIQEHLGNMRLKALVDELLPRYDACKKEEKKDVAMEVVQCIKKTMGGRFLSDESGIWIEVDDDIARKKASILFRNRQKQANTEASRRQEPSNIGIWSDFADKEDNYVAHKRAKVSSILLRHMVLPSH
jgi:hypothetical protein